jgi:uncharacterized protein
MDISIGSVAWTDITVPDATGLRDFYKAVVGWEAKGVDMGGYEDFNMMAPGKEYPTVGICHARGVNASLPPMWLIYVIVADIEKSVQEVERLGGKVLKPISEAGGDNRMCVIQDPAGAAMALFQTGQPSTSSSSDPSAS